MSPKTFLLTLWAHAAPRRVKITRYPAPFIEKMRGRDKRALGDLFGLTNFGVNITRLAPGAMSSLRHAHLKQDELIYVLEGTPTLITDAGETLMAPGMCAGFRAGTGLSHHLVNRSRQVVVYLEVGDRTREDFVTFPEDDLEGMLGPDGKWIYTRKDGTPY
jgi:uncharacterized cupin superfamily protein